MANLAIRGHATRGREVIELLEMLGGINTGHLKGERIELAYYIEIDKSICCIDMEFKYLAKFDKLTLEEFLEKFPYKVGDKVIIAKNKKEAIIDKISWCCDTITYWLKYDGFLEGNWRAENLQPYMEEAEMLLGWVVESKGKRLIPHKDYEIKHDGEEFYLVKKKPQYPKTCRECYKIFNRTPEDDGVYGYKGHLLEKFQELIICRDAYWKIAGEQMGLGKPWEPDFLNPTKETRYFLFCTGTTIENGQALFPTNKILIFPTEEMRDAFYENFKDLIESCKELL